MDVSWDSDHVAMATKVAVECFAMNSAAGHFAPDRQAFPDPNGFGPGTNCTSFLTRVARPSWIANSGSVVPKGNAKSVESVNQPTSCAPQIFRS